MPGFLTSGTDTFTYFDVYRQDRAEESELTLNLAEYCPRIRNRQPLYQDLGNSEEQRESLLAHFVKYVAWALCSKDPSKALENIETVSNYWRSFHKFVFTGGEESTLEDATEIEIETPERKRITWGQAHLLAFISLRDAEERRRHFAEEEAKQIAVWEELD